jgi:exosortase
MTPASVNPTPFDRLRLSPLARINLALLAALAAAFSGLLWPQWRHNPELSHGLFMPLIFLVLLHESRAAGPARFLPARGATAVALAGLLAAGLAALATGGLFTAALDWSHALVGFTLACALVLILLAGLLAFASEPVRLVPFNWISFTAVFLWLLCAPIPPGTYMRLTLGLQLWVTRSVLATLHLFGIAAIRNGNLIELAGTTVGIEEACSGVRSLISCIFAGFFFSAAFVRRPWSRVVIVALAAPLAIAMNFFRSLTLTLLTERGVDISHAWHDVTGYAVLGVTALLLGGLALWLARGEKTESPASSPPATRAPQSLQPWLAAGLALAVALVVLFVANTHRTPTNAPVPDLAKIVPGHAGGWKVQTATDLYAFADTLQTDHLIQRSYFKRAPDGSLQQVIIYIAYWPAGQAPVSLVASHTPDACLPGAGWRPEPTADSRANLVVDGRVLPTAEFRIFSIATYSQRVWFWHLYDGRSIAYEDPHSPRELLRLAWNYGFGHAGEQFFVRISSNCDWAAFADDPLMRDMFSRLQPYGL